MLIFFICAFNWAALATTFLFWRPVVGATILAPMLVLIALFSIVGVVSTVGIEHELVAWLFGFL